MSSLVVDGEGRVIAGIKGTWRKTENNRDAKYYSITRAGTRALAKETERWRRLAGFVDALLLNEP